MATLPRLLFTLGDVAGIGPEIIAKAWQNPALHACCRPIVAGDATWLAQTVERLRLPLEVRRLDKPTEAEKTAVPERIDCLQATGQDLQGVVLAKVQAAAGKASYDFLCTAIDHCLAGRADGIV